METFDIIYLWAKKSDDDKDHYSLLYHMLDTMAVTNQLWKNCLHRGAKHFIAGELNLSNNEYEASKWLVFFVSLHDFGKATPDFQGEGENIKSKLESANFKFNRKHVTYHGTATTCLPHVCVGEPCRYSFQTETNKHMYLETKKCLHCGSAELKKSLIGQHREIIGG